MWRIAIVLASLMLASCSSDATSSATLSISGTIRFPTVDIRNVAPGLFHMRMCDGMDGQREAYDATGESCVSGAGETSVTMASARFTRLFEVRATARTGANLDDTMAIPGAGEGEELRAHTFVGEIDDEGRFELSLPPSSTGYVVSVQGGRMRLKKILDSAHVSGDSNDIGELSLATTLAAELVEEMERRELTVPSDFDAQIAPHLDTHATALADALRMPAHRSIWRLTVEALGVDAGLLPDAGNALTDAADAPMNLVNLRELAENVTAPPTRIDFDSYPEEGIRGQYRPSGIQLSGLRFTPRGSPSPITEHADGYLVISDSRGESGVEIWFTRPVRSFGLSIQNGSERPDSGSARRGFRMTASFDSTEVNEYRWYTRQDGAPQFYGMTLPDPINRVRIEMLGTGEFTLDSLVFSPEQAELSNLGWRADGLWELVEDTYTNASYSWTSRGDTAYCDPSSDGGDYYDENRSGGKYWTVPYGSHPDENGCEGSCLWGPAVTLTNLPIDTDDTLTFDYWISGTHEGLDSTRVLSEGAHCSDGDPQEESQMADHAFYRISDPDWALIDSGDPSSTSGFPPTGTAVGEWLRPGVETMAVHWSHVHWEARFDGEAEAVASNTTATERHIEYSTDNGATWRRAWWYEDTNHHGQLAYWWKNHMHPFSDSDVVAYYENLDEGSSCTNTDFDKDGVADYDHDIDDDGLGALSDSDDCRQWDTEFYMDLPDPYYAEVTGDDPDSLIEGVTIMYRFRFDSTDDTTGMTCLDACDGWSIDDVSFNSDTENQAYYTSFDEFSIVSE